MIFAMEWQMRVGRLCMPELSCFVMVDGNMDYWSPKIRLLVAY